MQNTRQIADATMQKIATTQVNAINTSARFDGAWQRSDPGRHASDTSGKTSDLYIVRMLGAAGDLDGSRRGGVQSTEVVEKTFIAEHGGQRSQASML